MEEPECLDALKELNNLWIKAGPFVGAWSKRRTNIRIENDREYLLDLYFGGEGQGGQYWEGSYFHERLDEYGWKIVDIKIKFENEIVLTIKLGDVPKNCH